MSNPRNKSTKKTGSKGAGMTATPSKPATQTANVPAPPAPAALSVHADYDKQDQKWFWSVREGKVEHYASPDEFASDDKAKAAGAKWLAKYAKANDAAKRKMLMWKSDVTPDKAQPQATVAPKDKVTSAKKEKQPKRPSGLDAAAQVLKDAGKPMRCAEIVETMLSKGLWKTGGKTPAATIYAAIIREISVKKNESRFKKADRGLFAYAG